VVTIILFIDLFLMSKNFFSADDDLKTSNTRHFLSFKIKTVVALVPATSNLPVSFNTLTFTSDSRNINHHKRSIAKIQLLIISHFKLF
jgi:hypothetical protein